VRPSRLELSGTLKNGYCCPSRQIEFFSNFVLVKPGGMAGIHKEKRLTFLMTPRVHKAIAVVAVILSGLPTGSVCRLESPGSI
jgi:hypothetical protein